MRMQEYPAHIEYKGCNYDGLQETQFYEYLWLDPAIHSLKKETRNESL